MKSLPQGCSPRSRMRARRVPSQDLQVTMRVRTRETSPSADLVSSSQCQAYPSSRHCDDRIARQVGPPELRPPWIGSLHDEMNVGPVQGVPIIDAKPIASNLRARLGRGVNDGDPLDGTDVHLVMERSNPWGPQL